MEHVSKGENTKEIGFTMLATFCLSAIRSCCECDYEDDNNDSSILVPVKLFGLVSSLLDSKDSIQSA